MNDDQNKQIILRRSNQRLFGYIALFAIFTVGSGWMASGGMIEERGDVSIILGWIGAVFSMFGLTFLIHRLLFTDAVALELSSFGFVDRRLFGREVPWSSVLELGTYQGRPAFLLKLKLVKGTLLEADLNVMGRLAHQINRRAAYDRLYVSASDFDVSGPELFRLFSHQLEENNSDAQIKS